MPSWPRKRMISRPVLALGLAAAAAWLELAPVARADEAAWPRRFESPSGSFVIYQPQPENLSGDLVSCRAAFSLLKAGEQNPAFGVLWFTEHVQIDRDSSTADGRGLDVTRVRLPGITQAQAHQYEKLVEAQATQWDLSGSLQELQAGLAASEKERASVAGLSTAPPRILFTYQRALLLQYDGDPALEPIEGSNLQRAANTPLAIIYDPAAGDYYLSGAHLWYSSKDPLAHWRAIAAPPADVARLVPPDTSAADLVPGDPPAVLTATEPTELISIEGQPNYAPLVDGELLYVTNTESDVVREVSSQSLYVLLAGRWYRASSPDGPWSFVRGDQLPEAFSRVPADSPKGEILAAVAGTDPADDAVADAEIPQTSAIRRDSTDYQVSYDDSPQFEPIAGTHLQYALNTDAQIILADGRYYACDQGVWYVSDQAEGPWSVSETRPVEVDDIPPDCPVYNVRYVYIYDSTPEFVYMGYLPGYLGCFPYYGCVVYGTGYHYRPWHGRHHYFPRPHTWGYFPHYNPWLSRWSFGYSFCSGFLRTGFHWSPNRHLPGSHTPPLWFGPGGYHRPLLGSDRLPLRARRSVRNPQRPADILPSNIYNRTENLGRVDRAATRMPVHAIRPYVARPGALPNNVYAGQDGKVYQRDAGGQWQVNQGKRWVPAHAITRTRISPGRAGETTAPLPTRGAIRPTVRPFPTPAPKPVPQPRRPGMQPGEKPRLAPPARPVPPSISHDPGDLERQYHARERSGQARPPEASPAPTPKEPAPSPSAPRRPAPPPPSPAPAPPAHSPTPRAPERPEPKPREQPKEKN